MHKKYSLLASIYTQETLAYPMRAFSALIRNFAIILVFIIFWNAVFKNQDLVLGYTFRELSLYYCVTLLIRPLTVSGNSSKQIGQEIKMGTASGLMTKPIDLSLYFLVKSRSTNFAKTILPLVALTVITILFNKDFITPFWITTFFVSLAFASLINHYIYSTIGIMAFYTTETGGIQQVFGRFADILSGGLFPLDFLPKQIIFFAGFLPFTYMNYATISIYLLKYPHRQALQVLVIQLGWVIISALIYYLFFKRGIKHYESVGI